MAAASAMKVELDRAGISAMQKLTSANERLARAVEAQNRLKQRELRFASVPESDDSEPELFRTDATDSLVFLAMADAGVEKEKLGEAFRQMESRGLVVMQKRQS